MTSEDSHAYTMDGVNKNEVVFWRETMKEQTTITHRRIIFQNRTNLIIKIPLLHLLHHSSFVVDLCPCRVR